MVRVIKYEKNCLFIRWNWRSKTCKRFLQSQRNRPNNYYQYGDDETIQGVRLSPDIDSVIYALAGIEGDLGWGQKNDSFVVSEEFKKIFSSRIQYWR